MSWRGGGRGEIGSFVVPKMVSQMPVAMIANCCVGIASDIEAGKRL